MNEKNPQLKGRVKSTGPAPQKTTVNNAQKPKHTFRRGQVVMSYSGTTVVVTGKGEAADLFAGTVLYAPVSAERKTGEHTNRWAKSNFFNIKFHLGILVCSRLQQQGLIALAEILRIK